MIKQYKLDDILIVGDSFCHSRYRDTDWPKVITEHLTGNTGIPRGYGYPGCAWWSTRTKLIEELEISIPKIVILAHTEIMRIPSEDNYSLNISTAESGEMHHGSNGERSGQLDSELQQAASFYYKRLCSERFHRWSNLQWFKELDELLDRPEIEKVIHLFSFGGDYSKHTFKVGITVNDNLFQYHRMESGMKNHMSDDENIRLGKSILSIIENYSVEGTRCYDKLLK